jgi:hypothetical protein
MSIREGSTLWAQHTRSNVADIRDFPLAHEIGLSCTSNEQCVSGEAKGKTLLEYSGCFEKQLIGIPIVDVSCKYLFAIGLLLCQS